MYTHQGHSMGDAWYFVDEDTDTIHMFYLTRRLGDDGLPFVGHAVSQDLHAWQTLAPALHQGARGTWDDRQLCTGSVIKRQGRYWMAYAATNTTDSSDENPWRIQRAGMAVSDDLINWSKLAENPQTMAGPPYYEGVSGAQRKMAHWRDPFMIDTGAKVYQLICARRNTGDVTSRGTVALTCSDDMRTWEVLAPIEHDLVAEEIEVPQIYQIQGRWYLVFCTLGRFLSPEFAKRYEGRVPERSNFAMVSDARFGPYRIHGTGQIARHGLDEYFYAGQLVCFKARWYLLVTIHDEGPDRISDPIRIDADESGLHACP
jgi:beta-fructofuranosidase